jgi:hypothetical protein
MTLLDKSDKSEQTAHVGRTDVGTMRYQKAYGNWAGNPKGSAPDFTLCCEEIWTRERWSRHHQCSKKRGYGPDKAYCKQHDPAVAKSRRDAVNARSRDKWNSSRYQIHGWTFFNALLEIAEGHNDARGLAQKVIDTFKSGEMK